jgi:hypothetical protein
MKMDKKLDKNNENYNDKNEEFRVENIDLKDDTVEEIVEEIVKKPLSKNAHAKKLIDDSKEIIYGIDEELYETKNIVSAHIDRFKEEKRHLSNSTIAHSKVLLDKVNHPYTDEDNFKPFQVQLGTVHENISVNDINSGSFTGLLLALLGMIATALTWLFISNKVTGETIPLDKLPTKEFILEKIQDETLFSWIGGDSQVGMAVMGLSTLLIGYLIYKVRTSMRANKNLKIANDTFENSNSYVATQQESKTEILNLDKHIKKVTPLIENYRVLLDEQNAKLERIIHIEGALENHAEYQRTSQEVMADTEKLMESAQRLISTSITKDGKVNELSQNALIDAQVLYESYLSKLYA